MGGAIDHHGRANDGGIGAEAPAPQSVAENDRVRCLGQPIGLDQRAADGRLDSQKRKGVGRDPIGLNPLGHRAAGEIGAPVTG